MQQAAVNHIILENRRKLSVSGISDVDSYDDKMIQLSIGEELLTITGSDLKIMKMSVETGEIAVEGFVDGCVYSHGSARRSGGFLRKMLK